MIIIDLSQIMLANVFQSHVKWGDVDEDLLRHMVLNSIRTVKVKFGKEYGEIVVACDGNGYWRRQAFPYYKAKRRKAREDSGMDWKAIFGVLDKLKDELREFFPYRVVESPGAEADDIVATLVEAGSVEFINNNNPILIVSGDKDFIQLQRYPNVRQWDPINKRRIEHNDPDRYLREHIIRGDTGDGVPNVLSPDDSLALGKRQRPVTKKVIERLTAFDDMSIALDPELRPNFDRNVRLIDLSKVPQDVRDGVMISYDREAGKGKSKMVKYFMDNKLSELFRHINDF